MVFFFGQIFDNCETIPLYSPVGAVTAGTAHAKKYGIMTDCFKFRLSVSSGSINRITILI